MAIHKRVIVEVTIDHIIGAKVMRLENSHDGEIRLTALFDEILDTRSKAKAEVCLSWKEILEILFLKKKEIKILLTPELYSVARNLEGDQLKFHFFVPSLSEGADAQIATKDFKDAVIALGLM